jgi:HlyD family secretion protein
MLRRPGSVKLGAALAGAAVVLAIFAVSSRMLGQDSGFAAPGRVEGADPPMSIGVAASGIISKVLIHEGDHVAAGQLLITLDCRPLEADVHAREAHLAAAQAVYDRYRNGSRPDEIAVGEAVVGFSQARADEAQKTLQRTESLQEGVTVTTARVLEVQRDARIAAAQLRQARAQLALLRAGSREEDIRDAKALRDAAAADLEGARARFDACSVRAPADGVVLDVLVNQGQFLSLAVPQPLLHLVAAGPSRVRAEIGLNDLAHVCPQQHAAIAAAAFPNTSIAAHVTVISPVVAARGSTAVAAHAPESAPATVPVTLSMDPGGPVLPIGLPVTVHFAACPSKS